ncbi:MAG: TIGR03936 family radical SAM-associated protein [Armatimonadetes bacterium]|nr:TIGR03936 family radical SAM-associated protein [Armatimonadota bacterium]
MNEAVRWRAVITYRKTGRLRYLSHLDVTRAMERALRRAAVRVAYTQGYNQRMRLSFGPPLPVGAEGLRELCVAVLEERTAAAEIVERLRHQLPQELGCVETTVEPDDRQSPLKHLRWANWRIVVVSDPPVPPEQICGAVGLLGRQATGGTPRLEGEENDASNRILRAEAVVNGEEVEILATIGVAEDNYLSPDKLLRAVEARLQRPIALRWTRAVRVGFER